MNRKLQVFLSIVFLVFMNLHGFGQRKNIEPELNKNLIKGFDKVMHAQKKRSEPMVIGPDLHNQMGESAGYLIINSNYSSPSFTSYNSFPADDFVVPEGESWEIEYVRNLIYSAGSTDSIASVNVLFYIDNNGKPGTLIEKFDEVTNVFFDNEPLGFGFMSEMTITLPFTATLSSGKYWMCVQTNTNITSSNAYGDPLYYSGIMPQASETPIHDDAHFKHPGGGYYPFYDWTSATDYSPVFGGEPGIPYMPNYNFGIYGPAKNIDLAVTEIINPNTGGSLTTSEEVRIIVQNHGLSDVDTYELQYRVNGGAWIIEAGTAVSSGSEIEYAFHENANLSESGDHIIEVELVLASDENQDNNTINKNVTNYGTILPAIADGKVVYETCDGTFTDHGGLEDPYEGYSNDTVIFKSPDSKTRIRLEFYDTEMSGAYPFRFYNGANSNAPELGDWEALNSSEGVYTQEVHGLVLEGVNSEGAITVIPPGFDVNQNNVNNFMAKVSCVANQDTDFKVMKLETSKDLSWEKEEIELTATIKNRSLVTTGQLVTFYANGTEIGQVSATNLVFGESTTVSVKWTPETNGIYNLKAEVPVDEGAYADEKYFEFEKEIFEQGTLIESFEGEKFPPELWTSKTPGASHRGFIWYNNRPDFDGKWSVGLSGDTLVTPRLDIKEGDKLQFIYNAGFFGGTCDIMYAENINGPWSILHTVDYGWPWNTDYEVNLSSIVGVKYLAFKGAGSTIDYVRGPKLHFYDHDLMLVEFNGPDDPQVNTEVYYYATVKNLGAQPLNATDYTVKLWSEIEGVTTEEASVSGADITLSNNSVIELPVTFAVSQEAYIYATIEYAADNDQTNNTLPGKNISIIKEGVEYVYAGDPDSEENEWAALSGYYGSYTEVIYNKSELGVTGEISGISFYYMVDYVTDVELDLYIGETDLENLEESFLSTAELGKVVKAKFTTVPTVGKYVQQYIEFEKPYLYSGEHNLVMAFHRRYLNEDYPISIRLKSTLVDENVERWHGFQAYETNTDVSDFEELNALAANTYNEIPNVTFYVKTTDMDASLAGNVKDENSANFEGVLIELDGFANRTFTDVDGNYGFPVIPLGDMGVIASAYGYYNDTIVGTFTSGNETVVNFGLEKLPPVQITGTIIGNDLQQALANVEVRVEGYDLFLNTTTNAEGKFIVANLFADKEYQVTFEHPRYAELVDTVFVSVEGADLGTIELDELETPAFNLIATINDSENVDLTWQTPYTGFETMVDPTLGVEFGSYWYNEPDEDVQLGNLFRVDKPGTVTAIQFSNYAWPGAAEGELSLRFYNSQREEIMKPVPFMMPDSTVDWAVVEVPHFTYTDDFYVMIHWDRVHQQTGAIMSHQHNDNVAYLIDENGDWMLLTDLVGMVYAGAFSLKAEVIEQGSKQGSKELVSYDLWRSPLSEITNEENWVKMNTEPISGTGAEVTYTDETFNSVADDYYAYILQTQYTNDNAPYLISNSIEKGLFTTVTINVTANNTQDITGAKVVFENNNGAAINTYSGTVENGKVDFSAVRKGTYNLKITKGAAYNPLIVSGIEVNEPYNESFELREYIFTPAMLRIDAEQGNRTAEFSWGLGDDEYLKYDDNTFEQSLSIGVDGDAAIGNFFDVDAAGQIYNVEIYGTEDLSNNPNNEMGEVSLVVYNANYEIIGKSDLFSIQPDSTFNVALDFVKFDGPFYLMVKWNSDEPLNTHGLGVDTDSDPGAAYYVDDENGFVQLATWGYYGNFGIRANVLINGKKSSIVAKKAANTSAEMPTNLISNKVSRTAKSGSTRAVLSYNIYLNDMNTPIATGITDQSFTFSAEHFDTYSGETIFEAGVQAVFYTTNSIVVSTDTFTMEVGILNELDSKLNVYPNPAKDVIYIENAKNATVKIYNTLGELVKQVESHTTMMNISTSNLVSGSYFVEIKFNEGNIYRNLVITK